MTFDSIVLDGDDKQGTSRMSEKFHLIQGSFLQ